MKTRKFSYSLVASLVINAFILGGLVSGCEKHSDLSGAPSDPITVGLTAGTTPTIDPASGTAVVPAGAKIKVTADLSITSPQGGIVYLNICERNSSGGGGCQGSQISATSQIVTANLIPNQLNAATTSILIVVTQSPWNGLGATPVGAGVLFSTVIPWSSK